VPDALPSHARVVIVGAGALGCSIAWALAREGERDVVVLEKSAITHGSTWHAAGLIGQYRSRRDLTGVMQESVAVYDEIEAETPIDWRPVGSLRIASSRERWREYRAAEPIARRYGVGFELLDASAARSRFPFLSTAGIEGAVFVERDGYIDPSSLTQAYASRARKLGVRILEGVTVTGAKISGQRVTAIETSGGRIACEIAVLAPGVWARPVGGMFGLDLPVAALEHQYAVTGKRHDIPRNLPALRDPDLNFYLKPEVGGFAIGGWEPDTVPVGSGEMSFAFGRELLPDNLDRLSPILTAAGRRIPVLEEMGLRQIINGPIPVTPDGEPILGPAPRLANVWLAVGFTSGIAASGGAGRALARWIVHGDPGAALPSLAPERFSDQPWNREQLNARAIAAYASYYALAPDEEKGVT
jgi:sarcosine dehydrogenase